MFVVDRFVLVLAYFPQSLIAIWNYFLYFVIRIFATKELKRFFKNVQRVFNLPSHSIFTQMFLKQCIRHQVRCQTETILGIYNPGRLTINGKEQLEDNARKLLAQNKGLIIVTAHLGSWEFVAKYTGEVTSKVFYALAKPAKFAFLTKFLEKMRCRMNTNVLWTGRSTLLKEMITVLRKGEILGFVMDQKPANRKGPVVSFLGQPTEFVTGPASLALKTGAPILAVYCTRTSAWSFQLQSRVLYNPQTNLNASCDVDSLTALLAADLSATIETYPEQWTWSYKRWSDR